MIREYKTIEEISGPLMVVKRVQGVTYDELAEVELTDGTIRRCKVLEVNGDSAVVQLFESSAGINLAESKIRFLGHPLQLAVSGDMLGRVFNGMGQPIDGGPAILADEYRDINGLAMNPAARNYPNEFIHHTGMAYVKDPVTDTVYVWPVKVTRDRLGRTVGTDKITTSRIGEI